MPDSPNYVNRLGLGTAQFGLDYGISNLDGQVSTEEASRIIETAIQSGVRMIDTAALYGESEQVLGKILPSGHKLKIVTKTEQFRTDLITSDQASTLRQTFLRSLDNLACDHIHGLMIHHCDDLLADGGERLFDELQKLKSVGLVSRIGASVYTASQIDALMERFPIEIIQLPLNVLDQRLPRSGHLARLRQAGVEVHARSLFLQGVLLMDPDELPEYFDPVRDQLHSYHQSHRAAGLTDLQAALAYPLGFEEIDYAIVGVCSQNELEQILADLDSSGSHTMDYEGFGCLSNDILNPSNWRTTEHELQSC